MIFCRRFGGGGGSTWEGGIFGGGVYSGFYSQFWHKTLSLGYARAETEDSKKNFLSICSQKWGLYTRHCSITLCTRDRAPLCLWVICSQDELTENNSTASLPCFLKLRTSTIKEAGRGIFTDIDLPAGLLFGPYMVLHLNPETFELAWNLLLLYRGTLCLKMTKSVHMLGRWGKYKYITEEDSDLLFPDLLPQFFIDGVFLCGWRWSEIFQLDAICQYSQMYVRQPHSEHAAFIAPKRPLLIKCPWICCNAWCM